MTPHFVSALFVFIDQIDFVTGIFCFLIGAMGIVFPIHPKFDRLFGVLLLFVGGHYTGRALGLARLQHVTSSVFPLLIFIVISRSFRLRFGPRTRAALLAMSAGLGVTALIGDFHNSLFWTRGVMTYEYCCFGLLCIASIKRAIRTSDSYDRRLGFNLSLWLVISTSLVATDWWLSPKLGMPRFSPLIVLPFAYWLVFKLSSGPFRFFRDEIRHFGLDFILICGIVAILSLHSPQLRGIEGVSLAFTLLLCFFGYRLIRLRLRLGSDRERNWKAQIWARQFTSNPTELLTFLNNQSWVQRVKLVGPLEWQALKLDSVVDELRGRDDPALRPVSNADWNILDTLPGWLADAFTFAWESLGSDLLIYLPKMEKILAIQLKSRTLDPDVKSQLLIMSRDLRDRF